MIVSVPGLYLYPPPYSPMQILLVSVVTLLLSISIPLLIESIILYIHYKKEKNTKLEKRSKRTLITSIILLSIGTFISASLWDTDKTEICNLLTATSDKITLLVLPIAIYGFVHIPLAISLYLKKKPGYKKAILKTIIWLGIGFAIILIVNVLNCPQPTPPTLEWIY